MDLDYSLQARSSKGELEADELGEQERKELRDDLEEEDRSVHRSSSHGSLDSFQGQGGPGGAVGAVGPAVPPHPPQASQALERADTEGIAQLAELNMPSGKYYEYHCQWNERDLFGKVNLYGLSLRFYEEGGGRTLIKFDGLVGEWVFSTLQGNYGPIDQHDLYIGAKITVFGRHLTISSASGSAMRWIEKEKRRLEKHQDYFREKIATVGKVPCVKGKDATCIRHITRDKPPGQVDLRRLQLDTARLGEQIASLGLSSQLG
jgi:hypothetical protein